MNNASRSASRRSARPVGSASTPPGSSSTSTSNAGVLSCESEMPPSNFNACAAAEHKSSRESIELYAAARRARIERVNQTGRMGCRECPRSLRCSELELYGVNEQRQNTARLLVSYSASTPRRWAKLRLVRATYGHSGAPVPQARQPRSYASRKGVVPLPRAADTMKSRGSR